jgi:cytochrome c5
MAPWLTACNRAPAPSPEAMAARAATLTPRDARLAELYEHSCKACHAEPRAKAPLAGDRTAWQPRIAKGRDALIQSVLAGINGMPAGGQCFSCTPADYDALIAFMAEQEVR